MGQIRILIVEDEQDHADLIGLLLRRKCPTIEIVHAPDACSCHEALMSGGFDCVLLDYRVPPTTAPQLLEREAEFLEETPVIVLSALPEQRVVIESLRSGVHDFLPKHEAFNGENLWKSIQNAMRRQAESLADRRSVQRRLESLRHAADTDPLTGLENRRFGERLLRSERVHSDRRRLTSCVMFDIDHFKEFNDRLGHDAGDRVLCAVAGMLRSAADPGDSVLRWGGEEFVVIKPSTDESGAMVWAEKVRKLISESPVSIQGEQITVTVSAGVACVPTNSLGVCTLELCDKAMYLAKDMGRDQICSADGYETFQIAYRVGLDAPPGIEHRLACFREAIGPRLGPTQREYLGVHSDRVMTIAERIGRSMRLKPADLTALREIALAHDFGKTAIPERIWAKTGALTSEERRVVDRHAALGAELARALGADETVCEGIRLHHTWHRDARKMRIAGRAQKLAGIVAVCDALSAMLEERPYAPPKSIADAFAELKAGRGGQFTPRVVDTLTIEHVLSQAA